MRGASPRSFRSVASEVDHIRETIACLHPFPTWLLVDEFPLDRSRYGALPRIDLLAINLRRDGNRPPLTREVYEIKTNRRDFLDELRHPEKRRRAYNATDYYWFAVPEDMVGEKEVPPECGLYWVGDLNSPILVKFAKKLRPDPVSIPFMADLARRAYQVGRRQGSAACAFEHFELVEELAHMLIRNKATVEQRKALVLRMSRALAKMQRPTEAHDLARIARREERIHSWVVRRRLQGGMALGDRQRADSE